MASNSDYSTPPSVTLNEANSNNFKNWFSNLYYNLSIKNHQLISEASPINLDARFVRLQSAGAGYTVTLEGPTIPGVHKTIQKTSNNSDNIVLDLTNCLGGTAPSTCTFNSQNDVIVLVSLANSKWYIVSYYGVTFA